MRKTVFSAFMLFNSLLLSTVAQGATSQGNFSILSVGVEPGEKQAYFLLDSHDNCSTFYIDLEDGHGMEAYELVRSAYLANKPVKRLDYKEASKNICSVSRVAI